jgi:tetratricopeptide (TPR) repeat protein
MSKLLQLIWAWFAQWPQRRPWRDIPAILACLLVLGFGFLLKSWKPSAIRPFYTQVAQQALAAKDYEVARVACLRLLALGSESRAQTLFNLALALKGLGHESESAAILAKIAPIEKPVYAPAHYYAAHALMTGTSITPDAFKAILAHMNAIVALEPESVEANDFLGQFFFQQKNWAMAKSHFLATVNTIPKRMFVLAEVCEQLHDTRGAREWRDRALWNFKDAVEKSKTDSPEHRLCYAQALVLQGDFAKALEVLEEGRKRSDAGVYRLGIADVCAKWARNVAKNEPDNLGLRIKLIQQGLEQAPQSAPLLQLLVELSRGNGSEPKAAQEKIMKLLAEGGSSAILHFLVGSDAWQRGDRETAKKHFIIAFDLSPNVPEIANNMAVVLSQGSAADLPRALEIVDSALKILPDQPDLRDTRGGILLKLGRWKESIKDLEFALPLLSTKEPTHEALANAYAALGMEDLASEHRRLSKLPSN